VLTSNSIIDQDKEKNKNNNNCIGCYDFISYFCLCQS